MILYIIIMMTTVTFENIMFDSHLNELYNHDLVFHDNTIRIISDIVENNLVLDYGRFLVSPILVTKLVTDKPVIKFMPDFSSSNLWIYYKSLGAFPSTDLELSPSLEKLMNEYSELYYKTDVITNEMNDTDRENFIKLHNIIFELLQKEFQDIYFISAINI